MKNTQALIDISSYVALVAAAVIVIFGRVRNQNYKDLQDRVRILEDDRKDALKQHNENIKAIANLEGQLQTYKEIPLKQIAESLSALTKSNSNIESMLLKSALIAEENNGTRGLKKETA